MRRGGSLTRSPTFRELVRTDDGLRIARLAERTGFWPVLTDDPVVDFQVREALVRRLDLVDERAREKQELEARVKAAEKAAMDKVRTLQ